MRDDLLKAAFWVLTKKGVSGLTLDAVAAQAGASKGGVLYHFRSKDVLFEAMLNEVIRHCDADIEHFLALEPETPGKFVRAYIRASLRELPLEELEMGSAILGLIASEPSWARVYWPAVQRWRERALNDGIDAGLALGMLGAADGLSIWDALGVGEGRKELRAATLARLLELVGGAGEVSAASGTDAQSEVAGASGRLEVLR